MIDLRCEVGAADYARWIENGRKKLEFSNFMWILCEKGLCFTLQRHTGILLKDSHGKINFVMSNGCSRLKFDNGCDGSYYKVHVCLLNLFTKKNTKFQKSFALNI